MKLLNELTPSDDGSDRARSRPPGVDLADTPGEVGAPRRGRGLMARLSSRRASARPTTDRPRGRSISGDLTRPPEALSWKRPTDATRRRRSPPGPWGAWRPSPIEGAGSWS